MSFTTDNEEIECSLCKEDLTDETYYAEPYG
jgi:hypothetical protein